VKVSKALFDYLDGITPAQVAEGARRLDRDAWAAGQISWEALQKTLNATNEELFNQRNDYRDQETQ